LIPSIHELEEGRHVSVLPAGGHDQFVQYGCPALPSVRVLMRQGWKGKACSDFRSYTVKSRSSRVKLLSSSKKSAFKSFSDMH
jgi:hypothetical protein